VQPWGPIRFLEKSAAAHLRPSNAKSADWGQIWRVKQADHVLSKVTQASLVTEVTC
jgi:hypothetical protein